MRKITVFKKIYFTTFSGTYIKIHLCTQLPWTPFGPLSMCCHLWNKCFGVEVENWGRSGAAFMVDPDWFGPLSILRLDQWAGPPTVGRSLRNKRGAGIPSHRPLRTVGSPATSAVCPRTSPVLLESFVPLQICFCYQRNIKSNKLSSYYK